MKAIEILPSPEANRVSEPGSGPVPQLEPRAASKTRTQATPKPVENERGERKREPVSIRKLDIFTERVTLQISPEMRDNVERIARDLQRAKTSKEERITANTVMRVAILLLAKHFKIRFGEAPNTAEELYEAVEAALSGR